MKQWTILLGAAFLLSAGWVAFADEPPWRHRGGLAQVPASGRSFSEIARFQAPESNQGVAVSATHFFAIGNREIVKYDRETGRRVAEWRGVRGGTITHLNSCIIEDRRLVCAHSNYPALPMVSSIEVWDPETLEHVESRHLGETDGSLTWAIPKDGHWWLNFAHYGRLVGGQPGRGPEWSNLVQYDERWEPAASFTYPPPIIDRMRPYSVSGGNWGVDGRLYVTGHDQTELHVLTLPVTGSVLRWKETVPAPIEGQGWVFDPLDPITLWGISRRSGDVIVASAVRR